MKQVSTLSPLKLSTCGCSTGLWQSQPKSASVGCGFHVPNPSDADANLSRDKN